LKLKNETGFTLVELSIVIVIIGLIVAGVVGGQSLVKQAKLKNVISEFNNYKTAINIFKLEYDNLPGDMPNANSYWSGCNSGATANQCNGNGNRRVGFPVHDSGSTNGTNDNEVYRVWGHLSLSGIIKESYTGISTNGWNTGVEYGDIPFSKLGRGRYFLWATSPDFMVLELQGTIPGSANGASTLSVKEASDIDIKTDDGLARGGKLSAHNGSDAPANSCVSANQYNTANLSSDSFYCYFRYSGHGGFF